jgi:hypothetical protein
MGSNTLLGPFLLERDLGVGFSSRSSKRSGALRFREGRELGGGGATATFFAGVFFGIAFLGAAVFFVTVLLFAALFVLLAVLLGGGVPKASPSSSSSSRALFGLCLGARFAPRLDVGAVVEIDESFSMLGMALSGAWFGRLESRGEVCSEGDEVGEERGEESGSACDIFALLCGVVGGGVVVFSACFVGKTIPR